MLKGARFVGCIGTDERLVGDIEGKEEFSKWAR